VILASDFGSLDGDEAAWGTMSRHALEGELSVFFWEQNYGGTQETLLTAGVFAVAGDGVTTLRVVPILLFAIAAALTWRIGIKTVGEPYARFAAGAFCAWSPYVLWKSTRAHGFYGAGIVLGLAVVLLALRLADRHSRRDSLLLGLAFGLGWWATPMTLVLSLPAAGWLVWRRRRDLLPLVWPVAAGAIVGALPWLVENVRHDWYSLSGPPPGGTAFDRLHGLASSTLPSALGARLPFSLEWVGGTVVGVALYALMSIGVAVALWRCRYRLGPLIPVLLLFPLFYAVSPYAWVTVEPRYLVFHGPAFALLLVASGGTPRRAAAVAAALAALTLVGVLQLARDTPPVNTADGIGVPADLDPLLRALDARGVRHAWANFWFAWPIVFETDERLIAVPKDYRDRTDADAQPEQGRYPPFFRRVAADPRAAHIYAVGSFRERAERRGLIADGFRPTRAGPFLVYVRPPSR
jgi:hypothetical protein